MPIDIDANFKNISNHISNKSVVGSCLGNPIFAAFIIVAVICLVLFAYESEALQFQVVFYLSIFTVSLMLLHNVVLREQMRERFENKNELEMIRPAAIIGAGYQISPRIDKPSETRSEYIEDDNDMDMNDDLGMSQLNKL